MNAIQKYFKYRQALIDQYIKGDMSKIEYLKKNYEAVLDLDIEPFKNIDTVEKGLFNYQYFNAMAKNARLSGKGYDDYEMRRDFLEETNYFYRKKDKATLAVLKLLDYQNVNAYFIHVRSKYLKGKLFEIIIQDYQMGDYQMILHSPSQIILNNLRNEGVFTEEAKNSVIDGYINQKY